MMMMVCFPGRTCCFWMVSLIVAPRPAGGAWLVSVGGRGFSDGFMCVLEPTNMLDVRAILWLENYLQV